MSHFSVRETEEHEPLAKALELGRPDRGGLGPVLWLKMQTTDQRPLWADRAGSTVWQTLPACPDQQTSTNLPDQSGSGETRT
jgi:hypothetical protein